MTPPPTPLLQRLRALDPARAERQSRLIGVLNARRLGSQTLAARVALARDRRAATGWIRFRAGEQRVAIAPLLVEGELVRLSGGGLDAAVAARLLSSIEPLVVALESALGTDLYPDGLDFDPPEEAILLRLDTSCARHTVRHRLIVAVPPDGEVAAPALAPAEGPLLARLRVRWTAAIDTPAIPASHIGTIRPGDLYLLGLHPLVARISIPGRRGVLRGRLEPAKGSMTLQEDIVPVSTDRAAADAIALGDRTGAAGSASVDWTAMKLPATIEIDGGLLSASDIAALAAGSVLPVAQAGGALPCRVVAGGAVIGAGELVAVGDGFGVLFTSAGSSDAAEA